MFVDTLLMIHRQNMPSQHLFLIWLPLHSGNIITLLFIENNTLLAIFLSSQYGYIFC